MASKGKEVVVADPSVRRDRKGKMGASSSASKAGAQGDLEQKRCNVTLVREFYENWDTSFEERTKLNIRGQVVRFTAKMYNAFLETPASRPFGVFHLAGEASI
ncbi:hypothetical protein HAX54_003637 [Datura stramonium]|uniref:Uncharacterized protein n=1 Tax=Datura stramonium TaxID=4076 RepID=A0ABS8T6P5_DATST|nr:hypothetical protein [Datura stramonium]